MIPAQLPYTICKHAASVSHLNSNLDITIVYILITECVLPKKKEKNGLILQSTFLHTYYTVYKHVITKCEFTLYIIVFFFSLHQSQATLPFIFTFNFLLLSVTLFVPLSTITTHYFFYNNLPLLPFTEQPLIIPRLPGF